MTTVSQTTARIPVAETPRLAGLARTVSCLSSPSIFPSSLTALTPAPGALAGVSSKQNTCFPRAQASGCSRDIPLFSPEFTKYTWGAGGLGRAIWGVGNMRAQSRVHLALLGWACILTGGGSLQLGPLRIIVRGVLLHAGCIYEAARPCTIGQRCVTAPATSPIRPGECESCSHSGVGAAPCLCATHLGVARS